MAEQAKAVVPAAPKAPAPLAPDTGCQPGQDKRSSDLCAQWKAADAAYDSAHWAWWQIILASIGLVLGAVTMAAAIAAAVFARRAAVATEETVKIARVASEGAGEALEIATRNANAATDQVRISERTAHRQLRPYVHFERAHIIKHGATERTLSVAIKNYGRTPAKHCEISVTRMLRPYPLPADTEFKAKHLEATGHTIPPGASYEVLAPFPTGSVARIHNGDEVWSVTVSITYKLMDETNTVIEETVTETALVNFHDIQLGYGHAVLPRDYAHNRT